MDIQQLQVAEPLTALERFKRLQEEADKVLSDAKEEALAQAKEAVAALNELGLKYQLATEGGKKASKGTKTPKGGPCPMCAYETAPYHDRRKHRSQGDDKRPFTEEELTELGLVKV